MQVTEKPDYQSADKRDMTIHGCTHYEFSYLVDYVLLNHFIKISCSVNDVHLNEILKQWLHDKARCL